MTSRTDMVELLQSGEFWFNGELFRTIPNTNNKLACTETGVFVGGKGYVKPRKQSSGYLWLGFNNADNKARNVYAHRAVALCWISNPDSKPYVNHIDGDKHNNTSTNLEWCTAKENTAHALKTNLLNNLPSKGQRGFRRIKNA